MRLGDFRKQTANLPDDYILNSVWLIDIAPGYYDGYPFECLPNWKVKYTNEPKISFIMFDYETKFYDVCDPKKSYDENLKVFLGLFVRGADVKDEKWDYMVKRIIFEFDTRWHTEDWLMEVAKGES